MTPEEQGKIPIAFPSFSYRDQCVEWINVKDRLPKGDVECLITDGKEIGMGHLINDKDWRDDTKKLTDEEWSYVARNVTHWMPLPEAPK